MVVSVYVVLEMGKPKKILFSKKKEALRSLNPKDEQVLPTKAWP